MNERPFISIFRAFPAFVFAFFLLTSCDEEDPLPVSEVKNEVVNESNAYVNSWILENMEYWYLWNGELPSASDKNLDPESFFGSLLDPEDRFSWIQENYRDLLNSLQGITKEAGYEFVLYREKEGSDNVLMQILYIKPDSPATTAGLKRGDVI